MIEPILAGEIITGDTYDDDVTYVRDLGLIAPDNPIRIANPIYREVIVRVLAAAVEGNIQTDPRSFVAAAASISASAGPTTSPKEGARCKERRWS